MMVYFFQQECNVKHTTLNYSGALSRSQLCEHNRQQHDLFSKRTLREIKNNILARRDEARARPENTQCARALAELTEYLIPHVQLIHHLIHRRSGLVRITISIGFLNRSVKQRLTRRPVLVDLSTRFPPSRVHTPRHYQGESVDGFHLSHHHTHSLTQRL